MVLHYQEPSCPLPCHVVCLALLEGLHIMHAPHQKRKEKKNWQVDTATSHTAG